MTEGAECLWLFLHTAGVIFILSSCKPLTGYLYKCTETSQSYVIALLFENAATVNRVLCSVPQSCPTLCDPMDCSPPGSSVLGDSPGKNTGVVFNAFLQGNFPTQGSNPGLPHCRQNLYCLSHQGSKVKIAQPCLTLCNPMDYTVHGILQARILEWGLPLLLGTFPTQGSNAGLLQVSKLLASCACLFGYTQPWA